MELWSVFGSRSEYLNAPLDEAMSVRLALEAKWKIEAEKQAEIDAEMEKAKAGNR